ncbi:hypothetical protein WG66_014397 [Moniliophthora roreri]|nr:hypothetical protein WG66_014397 [Moniliophthora roreri]
MASYQDNSLESSEGVPIEIEGNRGWSATEYALCARVLICGQIDKTGPARTKGTTRAALSCIVRFLYLANGNNSAHLQTTGAS